MELILVRHGLPLRREAVDGPADPELSDEGYDQASRLAKYLATESINAIYSSPMQRAMQTADPLSKKIGIPISVVDEIAEFDRLSNEYIPIEELRAANDPRWHKLVAGEWDSESDTFEEFRNRVVSSIETLVNSHASQRIVIVCHGGVINQYLSHVLGISTERGFFYPHYTSIHRVIASQSGLRSLVTLNETAHLR
ncbi:MAG: histidine phosphatase family protein [Acidimicrobiaceae bacterium]|nr:histidine phosphatase family protein [Acidimicrobiaceae bacterium]